ncbi:MAG: hypothetical protein ACFFEN_01925 [Candidatus Thorarchaeota archaeon]
MILEKLKRSPKDKFLYILAIAGFLIVLLVEIFVFLPIEAVVPTYGILDYEFAWNTANVLIIFLTWGLSGINSQVIAIYWDFLFIVGYVFLAFSLIVLALRKSGEKIQAFGKYFPITAILTGVFDVIENSLLLTMANNPGNITSSLPLIASLSATIKFGLLFAGIIYFVIALIIIIINKIKKK